MAKKTNKTSHVLNLISRGAAPEPIEEGNDYAPPAWMHIDPDAVPLPDTMSQQQTGQMPPQPRGTGHSQQPPQMAQMPPQPRRSGHNQQPHQMAETPPFEQQYAPQPQEQLIQQQYVPQPQEQLMQQQYVPQPQNQPVQQQYVPQPAAPVTQVQQMPQPDTQVPLKRGRISGPGIDSGEEEDPISEVLRQALERTLMQEDPTYRAAVDSYNRVVGDLMLDSVNTVSPDGTFTSDNFDLDVFSADLSDYGFSYTYDEETDDYIQDSSYLAEGDLTMSDTSYHPSDLNPMGDKFNSKDMDSVTSDHTSDDSYETADSFTMLNVTEEIVRSMVPDLMKDYNMCTCTRCTSDVTALTLNNIQPKYVVTQKGKLYAKINACLPQYRTDVIAKITSACSIVKANSRHTAAAYEAHQATKGIFD